MQKVRLLVSGRVQGVGFRYSTYALALELEIFTVESGTTIMELLKF